LNALKNNFVFFVILGLDPGIREDSRCSKEIPLGCKPEDDKVMEYDFSEGSIRKTYYQLTEAKLFY